VNNSSKKFSIFHFYIFLDELYLNNQKNFTSKYSVENAYLEKAGSREQQRKFFAHHFPGKDTQKKEKKIFIIPN